MVNPTPRRRVSSPSSTGGEGTLFEQHVDAYWLALLLVRANPPVLHDCTVVKVSFQTEHLGWNTDDFLVVGEAGSGIQRKLAGQVKLTFTVSAADEECRKTIGDYWLDFKNQQLFSADTDRFVLVTQLGTTALLKYFSGLLDCARASKDGSEFERRLGISGFLDARVGRYCKEIQKIISTLEERDISAAEIWPFLRVLHVLSLDLNSSTLQSEAQIKTLLAYTTTEQGPLGVAEASWDALLRVVSGAMPAAGQYARDDLPETLRRRHGSFGGTEQLALRVLQEHSAFIFNAIRSTVGKDDLHLDRGQLVNKVLDELESTRVVVLSGPAGCGKSGLAKDVLEILGADHFVFSFRSVEFACPHLDETFLRSQVPATAGMLGALMAGQGRKLLLVESVERLLEASTRDAFTDLLNLVARDESWRLILTCRDYSTDLCRASFLGSAAVSSSVVTVPPLEDGELDAVTSRFPFIGRPLSNSRLRRLLRNPYLLDKALQIPWPDHEPLPESERAFRERFWKEIVRAEHQAARGMPRKREEAFVAIALGRARALSPYTPSGDMDAEVIDSLWHDSLIARSPDSSILVAPSHDVLEDWAILQWLDEQHATGDGGAKQLSEAIGPFPAVRRAFRTWIGELVDLRADATNALFDSALNDASLPPFFRDDTLVALLRSSGAAAVLEAHQEALFANDKLLLRRVIHLLRIACVKSPDWLGGAGSRMFLLNVPDGTAWASVLRLVHRDLDRFTGGERLLLLGLIEDWARGVAWWDPYPDGADSVAAIAHFLLPWFDDYQSEEPLKRTLQVIAKIPKADPGRFRDILIGPPPDHHRDRIGKDLREIVLEGTEGMAACRDLPELVISVAEKHLLCAESDLQDRRGYSHSLGVETLFGIKDSAHSGFFPASAYRGPFLQLLRHHTEEGLTFIISMFNYSADWYAHPRIHEEYVEPPLEIMLTFADGSSRKQWCNARLWNLYRGTTVGPYVLQCALMALEQWLLEFPEKYPNTLDEVLLRILNDCDSAALTGVVASVATALPRASGEALLVLLASRECIILDRGRLASESHAPSTMADLLPSMNAENRIYHAERKRADARPHRQRDLESAMIELQLGRLATRVQETLDRHRESLPPAGEQDENDKMWRLALHRMDLRQYTASDEPPVAAEDKENEASEEGGRVLLTLDTPDPDLVEMVDRNASQFKGRNLRAGLLMWGMKVFDREENTAHDASQWRQRLEEAETLHAHETSDELDLGREAPAFVVAVCVRDYWDELTDDEKALCLDVLCSAVRRDSDDWSRNARMQRSSMSGDRPAALMLPRLLAKALTPADRNRVIQSMVIGLTHAIHEVRMQAAVGIGKELWAIDKSLTMRCANLLASEASMVQQMADVETSRSYSERKQIDQIEMEVASSVRRIFFESDGIADNAHETLDPSSWFGAEAYARMLAILWRVPTEPLAVAAFGRLATALVEWWDEDDDQRHSRGVAHRERNHDTEWALKELLENFLLSASPADAASIVQPIVEAIDRHPEKVSGILQGVVFVEDRVHSTGQFWLLWRLFADHVCKAKWLTRIEDEYFSGREMLTTIFLGAYWKDDVRHWKSLDGFAHNIHWLFDTLPPCSTVLDAYVRFLYHVGEHSLPDAFARITKRLQEGRPEVMLQKGNTVFKLESLLQRYVFGKPLELKRKKDLREAVLTLLDVLIENGSSAAFRMRDDFVTPSSLEGQ